MSQTKMQYCFVRKDISVAQQIIQVGHAQDIMSLRREYIDGVASTCLFEVQDEKELIQAERYLFGKKLIPDKDYVIFYEPDCESGWTAIVTRPFVGKEREIFAGFKLYRDTPTYKPLFKRELPDLIAKNINGVPPMTGPVTSFSVSNLKP
jgi:hypothetical protein